MKVGDRVRIIPYDNAPGVIEEIRTHIVVRFTPPLGEKNGATLFRYITTDSNDLVLLDALKDNPEWSDSWEDSSK